MRIEYITPAKYEGYYMAMKIKDWTITAIKDGKGGYFLNFFNPLKNNGMNFSERGSQWMKLPKYVLNELDNFNSCVLRTISLNQ